MAPSGCSAARNSSDCRAGGNTPLHDRFFFRTGDRFIATDCRACDRDSECDSRRMDNVIVYPVWRWDSRPVGPASKAGSPRTLPTCPEPDDQRSAVHARSGNAGLSVHRFGHLDCSVPGRKLSLLSAGGRAWSAKAIRAGL
jgi:hypothetical protein